jgi:hypothetical protein
MAFWSAARRWAERAVVSGLLSVDDIRNDVGKACMLLPGDGSPSPVSLPQKSGAVAPGSALARRSTAPTTPNRASRPLDGAM